jgi:hypothetical protein
MAHRALAGLALAGAVSGAAALPVLTNSSANRSCFWVSLSKRGWQHSPLGNVRVNPRLLRDRDRTLRSSDLRVRP